MKVKRGIRVLVFFGMVLLLTGCWNRRELKDLAFVSAIGIDKAPEADEYKISFQIINPSSVSAGGASGGVGGQTPVPITVYSGTGKTVFEAIRKTSKKVPRQLFFAHMQLMIIGEPFAREGIQELFDYFERSHEIRLTTMVLVARGIEAGQIVRMLTPLEKIPANSIAGKLKMTSRLWSENIRVEIDEVIKALVSEGEPMISGVIIAGDPEAGGKRSNVQESELPAQLDISGIALFKNGKLNRWLDGEAGRGALWIRNKMRSTVVELDCNDKKDAVGIEIVRSHTNIEAEIQNGKPVFHITIKEEGNISEAKCPLDLSKTEEIAKLEKQWVAETKKEVMAAMNAARKEGSDVFGFGEAVNRTNPKAWNKMKKEWDKIFAESKVDIKVDAFIRRSGMRLKPYLSEQEGAGKE